MKKILKRFARQLPFALTKNIKYDKLTEQVIKQYCKPDTNCVDVGCHKGEIMDLMIEAAPNGNHYGFEPIPELYGFLREKFKKSKCTISDIALSNKSGIISFNYVLSNPSYSGIKKRNYDRSNEKDITIDVRTERLDDVIDDNYNVGLIKIDVEGAELIVLEGAEKTISRSKPLIIFEFGLGASDVYGADPKKLWRYFTGINYNLSLLDNWLKDKTAFTLKDLEEEYYNKSNHYFIAWSA
jgi:FkbM family methyltransferase